MALEGDHGSPGTGTPHAAAQAPFDVDAAYRAHGGSLYGFARAALGDDGAAEDCVQEVFLRAWRAREGYDGRRASERTWLFAIARNAIVDALRARARRPVTPSATLVEDPDPAAAAEERAVIDRVVLASALAGLSEPHREVVTAVHLRGWTYGQLAERTGVPVATLRTRMYYATRALRSSLGEEQP